MREKGRGKRERVREGGRRRERERERRSGWGTVGHWGVSSKLQNVHVPKSQNSAEM
jgi:hypothetical protein